MKFDMAYFTASAVIMLSALYPIGGRRLSSRASEARVLVPSDVAEAVRDVAFRGCSEDSKKAKEHAAIPFIRSASTDLSCRRCHPGYVLLRGSPPLDSSRITKEDLAKSHIKVKSHCAELDGDAAKKLIMIRHGQSRWNRVAEKYGLAAQSVGMLEKYQDSPLSKEGLRQAQRLAVLLRDADRLDKRPDVEDSPTRTRVRNAIKELDYTDLSEAVKVRRDGHVLTNSELLEGLRNHREELDALLGKNCSNSVFVTSQLTRAMDTFNIAMLQARLRCNFSYEISSNLQEFEHNRDCEARTPPGKHPTFVAEQRDQYIADQMEQTFRYVEEQYRASNIQRFTHNLDTMERQRIYGNDKFLKAPIQNEISNLFGARYENTRYALFGGHSIWFRYLFKFFGDQQNRDCKQLAEVKMANVGIVSATLRKVHDPKIPYVLVDCKWIHLGPSDEFKYEFDSSVISAVEPRATDFRFNASTIVGWKCCCAGADPGKGCLLARSTKGKPKCRDVKTWDSVRGLNALTSQNGYSNEDKWKSRHGWREDSSRPQCVIPSLG